MDEWVWVWASVRKLLSDQTGPSTLEFITIGQVNNLDGVEAFLQVSGGLFDGAKGRWYGDGRSTLKVGFALEEEYKNPNGHGT